MFGSLRRRGTARHPARANRPQSALQMRVEVLEDRCVPATLIVDPNVPTDYQTIGAAVSAANTGDTIQVAPGTYNNAGDLSLALNKAITIESTSGATSTIIDCSTSYFAFLNANCTIQGFTFENANSGNISVLFMQVGSTINSCVFSNDKNFGGNGAAMELNGGTSTISNSTFDHCDGSGAISASGGSADISNCTFTNGNASSGGGGGAINLNTGTVTITGSTFSNNTGGGQAGGVFYYRNGSLTVSRSTFTNNSASYGGVLLAGAQGIDTPASFTQCTFSGNTASLAGGVAALEGGSSGTTTFTAINCLFIGNSAASDGAAIDGITAGASPNKVNVINSSFYGNTVTSGSGTGVICGGATTTTTIVNSILYGDTAPREISTAHPSAATTVTNTDIHQSGYAGSNGNINADPLYINPAGGDLRVPGNSPAVNAGRTGAGIPTTDFAGNARDVHPDMGALEYAITVTNDAVAPTQYNAFSGEVATFVDSTTMTTAAGAFSATIDWGDATGASAGTITQPGGPGTPYRVTGTHTYTTFGVMTLTVTIAGVTNLGAGTNNITVAPDVATHFVVSAPSTATAGNPFNITITAEDAADNIVPGYAGTVHFTSSDGAAVLPGNTTLTNGTATFPTTLTTAGNQALTATDTLTSSITGTGNTIAVSAAAATHFTVTAPVGATAGRAFSYTIAARDPFNNTATNYAGTVHFTSSDGQAVLPGDATLTTGTGTGTFSAALRTAGNQTLTAIDTVTSSITGTSGGITVSAAALPPLPLVIGTGPGAPARVTVYGPVTGQVKAFVPYGDAFLGGVTVAAGDVTGDGIPDVVMGTASGSSHVKVFDGATGVEVRSFIAFPGFTGGVNVAAGDINNDGFADVVVGAAANGHVKVFDGATGAEIRSFFPYPDFSGGADVAVGDVDGDGYADVITAAGVATYSHVKAFSGATGAELASFLAPPGLNSAVSVAAADLDGDRRAELLVGSGVITPMVTVFHGGNLAPLTSFAPYPGAVGLVHVGVADRDGDGQFDVVTGTGPALPPHVKGFRGSDLALLDSFYVTDSLSFNGGVFVG